LNSRERISVFPRRKEFVNLNYSKTISAPEVIIILEIVTNKLTVTFIDTDGEIRVGSIDREGVRIALRNGKQYIAFFD